MSKQLLCISDELLKEILPSYLRKKLAETILIQELFLNKDYAAIQIIAHNMKGTALSYGIEKAGEMAALLECALKENDYPNAIAHFKSLKDYLDNLEVVYVQS